MSPKGMNPTFMLASRKNGGIGSAYAEKLRAFYEQQPDTCDMSVLNIYTGQSYRHWCSFLSPLVFLPIATGVPSYRHWCSFLS